MTEVENNNNEKEEEEDIPEYQRIYDGMNEICENLITTFQSFSVRTFPTASNYKQRMGLDKSAPGKQDFRKIQTKVRAIRKLAEQQYKALKPPQKREQSSSKRTGFNRLVQTTKELRDFMKLIFVENQ